MGFGSLVAKDSAQGGIPTDVGSMARHTGRAEPLWSHGRFRISLDRGFNIGGAAAAQDGLWRMAPVPVNITPQLRPENAAAQWPLGTRATVIVSPAALTP